MAPSRERLWLLVVVIAVGGCSTAAPQPSISGSPQPSISGSPQPTSQASATVPPATTPAASDGGFAQALSFLTPDARSFFFNDWAAIKASLGASDVTSLSTEDEKRRVLVEGMVPPSPNPGQPPSPSRRLEAAVDGYGSRDALRHADTWNFDLFDYEWEATLYASSIHVIRFRPGFDLGPVVALFDERDYATERVGSATLRTHELNSVDWRLGDPAILNVALLDDGRTMLLSAHVGNLRAYLTNPRPALPAYVSATEAALHNPWAVIIVFNGPDDWCTGIPKPDPNTPAGQLLATAGPLSGWDALAVGYSRDLSPIGRIAIAYADAAIADEDLAGRRLLAEEGFSLMADVRLADRFFTVQDASSSQGVIRIDVAPYNDWPARLFQPVYTRDLPYAACDG